MILASLTNIISYLIRSSLCLSFEISNGVWSLILTLKYSNAFSWISLCFPLMQSNNLALSTSSFFLVIVAPHVTLWNWRWSWSQSRSGLRRCKESRQIHRVVGSSDSVLLDRLFKCFSIVVGIYSGFEVGIEGGFATMVGIRSGFEFGIRGGFEVGRFLPFPWLVVFGYVEKDWELGETQAAPRVATMPPNPWLIYHNPNPWMDFSLPHSLVVDCLSLSHFFLLIMLLVVLRLLVFL